MSTSAASIAALRDALDIGPDAVCDTSLVPVSNRLTTPCSKVDHCSSVRTLVPVLHRAAGRAAGVWHAAMSQLPLSWAVGSLVALDLRWCLLGPLCALRGGQASALVV